MTDVMIHPSAIIDPGARLGPGCRVWQFVHVCEGAAIGRDCVLGQGVYIGPGVRVGNGVKIQNQVSVYAGVTIEDDVFLGPGCVFTNVRTPRAAVNRKQHFASTLVKRGATIGANATIVCGVTIHEHAFVGAGAVVTHDVPARRVVVGNPAAIHGWACVCGAVLRPGAGSRWECAECGAGHVEVAGRLETDA